MARSPSITVPRDNSHTAVRQLANQVSERLNKADAAIDEAARQAKAGGQRAITALTGQINSLTQVVNQLALTVQELDAGAGSTTLITNALAGFDADEPEDAFF